MAAVADLATLAGYLACHCKGDQPCHGDVPIKLFENLKAEPDVCNQPDVQNRCEHSDAGDACELGIVQP